MEIAPAVHSTFVLERKLKASPERVFAAFSDPATKRRWFYENSKHEFHSHEMDFKVGGVERAQMKLTVEPVAGMTLVNDVIYEEIQPNRRIVSAYRMSLDGRPFSVSIATIELSPADSGTELTLTHQGTYLEGADGPAMRKDGWEHLLDKLVKELGE